ncbi:Cof-type HAD-IIB family hydrolase [Ammoniphilus sp. 3BR4]|uniref:Cof-type HAD-IIB family hydrolase n=1 Tax=Ammoniphilus sp. 3BR4 TaxID=3158265 RepID=UPI003465004C
MSYEIVFFDIDGTLVNEEKNIPEDTKAAVQELKQQGVEVAIATGRAPFHFKHIAEELGIESFVSFNGSYVVYKGQPIYGSPLNIDSIEWLEIIANEKGHPMVFLSHETCYANQDMHPYVTQSFESLKVPAPDYHACYWKEQHIYQALLFCKEEERSPYEGIIPDLSFVRWHPYSLDVIPSKGSKAIGIQAMLKHLGLSAAEAVAFGDGLNDKEMLSYVGVGIAMGNAHVELKPLANFITKHVDEGGIRFGLEKLQLI